MIRNDLNDQIFRTSLEKDNAIIQKIKECNEIGQPLLVFTSSINKSEHYSNLLEKEKIKHIVLNAKNHEKEAEIIANAGKINSVIITTSISGRGVDIKLGGQNQSEKDEVKKITKSNTKAENIQRRRDDFNFYENADVPIGTYKTIVYVATNIAEASVTMNAKIRDVLWCIHRKEVGNIY